MNEINHIEKAIEYLQSLKEQNAVVDKIEINYGWRYKEPFDEGYCDWMESKTPDGSFYMQIHGKAIALYNVSQAKQSVCPCYCDMWLEPNEKGETFCSCGKRV